MPFALAPHCHMAIVDTDVVLLDAGCDRYACLPGCDATTIREGYRDRRWNDGAFARDLANAGYLVPSVVADSPIPPSPAHPERDLYMSGGPCTVSAQDVLLGSVAALAAAWQLATQKPRHWLAPRSTRPDDMEATVAEARRFAEARLFLPGLGRCLPSSLALLAFLKLRGRDAQLIFGVSTHPFEAHCWVQSGSVVLNDTLTHVCWYTPIAWS